MAPQIKWPREFKFVGGPSRKRRRLTPPASRRPQGFTSPPCPLGTTAAVTKNDKHSSTQPKRQLVNTDRSDHCNIEASKHYVAHGDDASRYGDTRTTPIPSFTPTSIEAHTVQSIELSSENEAFESLFGLPMSIGLSMASDAVGSVQELDDHQFMFDESLHHSNFPDESLGNYNHLVIPSKNYTGDAPRGHGPQRIVGATLPRGSSDLTEDLDKANGHNMRDPMTIPCTATDEFGKLFVEYDRDYCVWPLTHDFEANPFRSNMETCRRSPLLWHSIMALCYKHVQKDTGLRLSKSEACRRRAEQLLEALGDHLESAESTDDFLNGLLILITLDCTSSAEGPWVTHLHRARKAIEAVGELEIRRTAKIRAQIDMLVWWDVTLGFITRQGYVLSNSTISSVFSSKSASTFYNISGCPEELFKYMFQLSTYANEFELASHMSCVTFDMDPVMLVEKAVKTWRGLQCDNSDVNIMQMGAADLPSDSNEDPVQSANYMQDLYHCAEAWRYALLLYIERVFKWRLDKASMACISLFARRALTNVLSCRRGAMIQKQLLLPVFLAACETADEDMRAEARKYCRWWNEKTRYGMFITTIDLLEEVWAVADDPESWWGSVLDRRSDSSRQFLFG